MIPDFTLEQLRSLTVSRDRPLVICDVDDVVVHFLKGFEAYLAERGLYFDAASFALTGNIRDLVTDEPEPQSVVLKLVDDFFVEWTEHLAAIDGAADALLALAEDANIVMLTNLPHHARDKRINNLRKHGLYFPCVTNSGPKGPAIRHLAEDRHLPVVFIDDSPNFIASSREYAPQVHLVHFLHDERFARHLEPFPFVSLTTRAWSEALPHILALIR